MPEPIRVLRVIARLNVGGPALHVSYLTNGLADRGYDTTLVTGSIGEGEGSMEYVADELGVEPVYVPVLQREVSVLLEKQAVDAVLDLIRRYRPHVLHTHTAKAGAIGRFAALRAGRDRPPVVVHTFHGHVLRGYFGPRKTRAYRAIERTLARTTDALVTVSPEVRDDLVDLGVAAPSKFSVIRLGLDLERRVRTTPGAREDFRRSLGIPEDRFLVGWLGRMTDIKRAHDLVDAVAHARRGGANVDLVLVGDGPLRHDLARQADHELGHHAHLVGFTRDVAPVYAGIDAVALTSANEGTPVTVIEALAAGRPAVATAVGGVPDVIRPEVDGFLAPMGDVRAIGDAIGRLAADPARAAAMGEAARARVVQRYAVPRLVDDVDSLYRTLLSRSDPARARTYGALGRPLTPVLTGAPSPPRRTRRPLRVTLLSQYYPPEVGATQSRMQSFADHLAAQGHDVTVICEFPNHPHGIIPEAYHGRIVEDDRSNAYRVLRVWVKADPEKTQRSRMAFYLSYMALATALAPRLARPDVVVATSPPLFAALAGSAIAKLTGAPFVLDVRDLWPDAAVSLGQLSHPTALRASRVIEQHLYRTADAVVAVTQPFCDHIDRIRARAPRTSLIPNGTLEQFLAGDPGDARARLGIENGAFVATFAGNLGIAQSLPSVIDAAGLAGPAVQLAVIGDGPIRDALAEQARVAGVDNVHFHPQVPLDRIPPFLAASDALLVTLSGHETFADFVPSKMLDFMAAGKPVVLSAHGEAVRILERAGGGIAVPPENPAALSAALLTLQGDPDRCRELGAAGRRFALRRLRSAQAERLEALLHDVARSHVRRG